MITTTPCDEGDHRRCPGKGLVRGELRPPNEPEAEPEKVWVRVGCECACHIMINKAEVKPHYMGEMR